MRMENGLLFAAENYTSFSLVTKDGEELDNDYLDMTMDQAFPLLCPKCKKQLTKKEYKEGKLKSSDERKKGIGINDPLPEDLVQYSLMHKRCPNGEKLKQELNNR